MSEPEANRLLMLVDWDNLDRRRGGTEPETKYRVYLQQALALALRVSGASRVDIRLYGGWMAEGQLSRSGSEVAAVSAGEPLLPARHPVRREVLRGTIELVRSMMGQPSFEPSTYEEFRGANRVKLAGGGRPEACSLTAECCPAQLAKRFTRSWNATCPTAGCEVTADHVFVRHRQKMVDTMLTCDAVLASANGYERLAIVSSDADLVPACLTAANAQEIQVLLLQPWPALRPEYLEALGTAGVECHDLGLDPR